MAKKVIAVLGATGHIGTVLTEELLKKGHDVVALGRDAGKLAALEKKGAKTKSAGFDDAGALAAAFKGVDAAFTMIPPSYFDPDFSAYQDRTGAAIATALGQAGVKHAVDLSSVGAQHPSGNGPIAGLHRQEKRLEQVKGLNPLHLRPSYFMENHFWSISTIKTANINGSPIFSELRFGQIATADIARKIAELLDKADWKGRSVVEFAGPRDLTMVEATQVLGKAVGKPDLKYVEFPYEEAEKAMTGMGMPAKSASLMVDMYRGFNEGVVAPESAIKERGSITLEDFARGFAAAYKA